MSYPREFELLSTLLQDGERKDEQHQRGEQTKYRRHPGGFVLIRDTEEGGHHHHPKDEPDNAKDNSVLPGEDLGSDRRLALVKLRQLRQESAVC